jgi:thymidylate kinase
MMFTVALIGPDGSGKTTVAKNVMSSCEMPMKYLYMGRNVHASNVLLPTSRLVQLVRGYLRHKCEGVEGGKLQAVNAYVQQPEEWWNHDKRGRIFATVRLANRLAEEWFRQMISWFYQVRGYVVLYDRHFMFDQSASDVEWGRGGDRVTNRLHRWVLREWYPNPDLVIFLDAPAEILYERKGETTVEYLELCREKILKQGKEMSNFIRIDASQPLHMVCAEVSEHIRQCYGLRRRRKHMGTS